MSTRVDCDIDSDVESVVSPGDDLDVGAEYAC